MYARAAAAAAMALVSLVACVRLYQKTRTDAAGVALELLGLPVPYAAIWSAGVFVALGCVIFLFTFGLNTGLGLVDGKAHGLIDLLIDTEAELAKVSWPSPDELRVSTAAVLVSIVVLGVFLLGVDALAVFVMRLLGVLPG
jgi:preprotein translocase SecE subunit